MLAGQLSGTTVTLVIIEGFVVTVASVGDSRCILESADGSLHYLSADHRFEDNDEETERVTSSGGEVGRLNTGGGTQIGPLRCWPGGLCLSRSIGDLDVGEFIVPVPYVKQVKVSYSTYYNYMVHYCSLKAEHCLHITLYALCF
ncbi:Protein phosphatase 2C [Artemisia annua]|uniref:Protein phosphatase 2C n=1 Tax=Artemisia annua TaxID=35608 RepID=A0A2U1KEI8_ARTAN|nr:Protein phosphatase 2C [Artemisia annua]